MCDKSSLLFIFIIIKIIIILIPIFFIINKRVGLKTQIDKPLFIVEIILLFLLIGLRITNNCLVNNSTLSIFYRNIKYNDNTEIILNSGNDANIVKEIITDDIYKTRTSGNVYYFNNNTKPLSDKRITCEGRKMYMKNYGNSLTAASIIISSTLNNNIDPIALLNLSVKNNVIDCDNGITIENILNLLQNNYNVHYTEINNNMLEISVSNGIPVLAEIKYNSNSTKNLTCSKSYIVIYNIDNNGKYKILNPNENNSVKICPENTEGELSLIDSNSNNKSWSSEELTSIINRLWVVERN